MRIGVTPNRRRRSRTHFGAVAATLVIAATGTLGGCATTVLTGVAVGPGETAETDPSAPGPDPGALVRAVLNGGGFPAEYQTLVLDDQDAVLAAEDLSAIPRAGRVNPVRCQAGALPAEAADFAMASGTEPEGRQVLALEVERGGPTVDETVATVQDCREVTVVESGVDTRVLRSSPNTVRVGGHQAVTYTQQVTDADGTVLREMAVARARRGDVTVTVTGMDQHHREVDAQTVTRLLDTALTAEP